MERELVAKAGYDYAAVEVSSFQRKLNGEGIRHNLHALRVLLSSGRQARAILRDFRPDLVVGTGGYVSGPVVRQAQKRAGMALGQVMLTQRLQNGRRMAQDAQLVGNGGLALANAAGGLLLT